MKAYRAMDAFRGDCSEKTWLTRIAINTCRDMKRSEMKVSFDLSLTDLPVTCSLALSEPVLHDGVTLQYRRAEATPLQTTLTLLLIPDENSSDAARNIWNEGYVALRQTDGSWLDVNVLSGRNGGAEQLDDGRWCESYTMSFAADQELPETISMSFVREDGTVLNCPSESGEHRKRRPPGR